ncbi:universal stress protein [Cyanobacterium aponinum UTEX 3222]|uniref:Universal stress protein n=2 Tax=Cyanobacterium aponinum TaxID=379064 RepID=A0A844GVD5_9CHRO|nr:universal stress protein [Cyanobacterium aponinum]WRL43722.1 universal stress protein [Cyanobacterium aponinum UTEX 3222]MBD2393929.1 universal stress protein [Cyanobacterium aponinum FACHB-4101]MTF39533.1 universal stress protein [Cyanobacterium aponinum 0216]WPF89013.1 universal stress protein [Cyanobacterium aponinum AL20115]WRL37362.1 universal stress protein [Cyanobacterium aponinum UTEX 3221]
MLDKILYADSGTGHTQEMLKILLDIPAFKNSEINILHVIPPQVSADALAEKWEEGGKILSEIVKNVNIDPSKVATILKQGDPKDTVCNTAQEINADLILMGSRGLKRLESFLENSVSQYVFQLSDRPMLLVKDDIYVRKIKKVMLALDKSESSSYALEMALYLLRDYREAELYLVRVNPDMNADLELSTAEMEQNPILAPALQQAKRMGISAKCIVKGGKPAQQICKLADDNNIDLLLLGSPDRRPSIAKSLVDLDRLLGTSLSDYVRVNANCPVLLVRK